MRRLGDKIYLEDDDRWLIDAGVSNASMPLETGLRLAGVLFAAASRHTRLAECFQENEMWVDAAINETEALEREWAAQNLAELASSALGVLIESEFRRQGSK